MARNGKTGTAVAAPKSSIPANWRQKLLAKAQAQHEAISVGVGNKMSITKKGTFQFQGGDLGEEIEVVILAMGVCKVWYDRPYVKDEPGAPACFALKLDDKNIAPHADAPLKQAEVCAECPKNEWGSTTRKGSRGKACADKVRLALIHVDDIKSLDDISQAEIALMELPVTSGGTFKKYAKKVTGATDLPLWCLVTKLTADGDAEWEAIKAPELVSEVPSGMLEGLEKLAAQGEELILTPYDVSGFKPAAGSKSARSSKKSPSKRSRMS